MSLTLGVRCEQHFRELIISVLLAQQLPTVSIICHSKKLVSLVQGKQKRIYYSEAQNRHSLSDATLCFNILTSGAVSKKI